MKSAGQEFDQRGVVELLQQEEGVGYPFVAPVELHLQEEGVRRPAEGLVGTPIIGTV